MADRAAELEKEKVDAATAALASAQKAELEANTRSAWLYKRGGFAKSWRQRWFCVERGVLQYYVSEADKRAGHAALGALVLTNATVRLPTSAKPGKYKFAFRVDLDLGEQRRVIANDEEPDSSGRLGKAKWLMAAESSEEMNLWMSALQFWTKAGKTGKTGHVVPAVPSLTQAEVARIKETAVREAEAEAERMAPKVFEVDDVGSMSMAALREVIAQAGLSSDDCLEKADMRARATEAIHKIKGTAVDISDGGDGGRGEEGAVGGGLERVSGDGAGGTAADGAEGAAEEPAAQLDESEEEAEFDDGYDDVASPQEAAVAAAADEEPPPVTPPPVAPPPKGPAAVEVPPLKVPTEAERRADSWKALWVETRQWTPYALRHQLTAMGEPPPEDTDKEALVSLYYSALVRAGKDADADARRFLRTPTAVPDTEELVRTWVPCVTGVALEAGDLQPQLRSGVLLCRLINALRPGVVPKVAEDAATAAMPEAKRNATLRQNIGQYVDACGELGLNPRELFTADDLFEGKDLRAVLKNIEGLSRHAQGGIAGYTGPLIGKKYTKKEPPTLAFYNTGAPGVVLSSPRGNASKGGGHQGAISGRGNM